MVLEMCRCQSPVKAVFSEELGVLSVGEEYIPSAARAFELVGNELCVE